jgi:hypothetical protein
MLEKQTSLIIFKAIRGTSPDNDLPIHANYSPSQSLETVPLTDLYVRLIVKLRLYVIYRYIRNQCVA